MKRIIGIITIIALLFTICLMEELLVSSSLKKIKADSKYLYTTSLKAEDVSKQEIYDKTMALQNFWKKREVVLCFYINYKDMSEMSNELVKMVSYSQSNIKEEYLASLQLLMYYCETFNHITGLNLQNIF